MSKKGLGRGLGSLIPMNDEPELGVNELAIEKITVNPRQPRRKFNQEKLQELADSIKIHGVVQPVVVRKLVDNSFELIAGERRFRASKLAGLKNIPAVVKQCSDKEMAELALIENIQREDLDPIEEANAYKSLIEEYKFTQESLSERIGKSRPVIANLLRVLSLPIQVQRYISDGKLSMGHAKVLMGLDEPSLLMLAVEKVVRTGCSVRETEQIVKNILNKTQEDPFEKPDKKKPVPDPVIPQIEDRLRTLLRTQVKIKDNGEKGKIEIEYYSKDDLSQIVDTLLGELI